MTPSRPEVPEVTEVPAGSGLRIAPSRPDGIGLRFVATRPEGNTSRPEGSGLRFAASRTEGLRVVASRPEGSGLRVAAFFTERRLVASRAEWRVVDSRTKRVPPSRTEARGGLRCAGTSGGLADGLCGGRGVSARRFVVPSFPHPREEGCVASRTDGRRGLRRLGVAG